MCIRDRCNDTLYIVDGVDNTIVAVSNASNLLEKDEIVVQPGGKKFKCAYPTKTVSYTHLDVYKRQPYLRDLRLDREVATADYQYGQS